jgi:cytochrome P450
VLPTHGNQREDLSRQPPGPGLLSFIYGVRTLGFLDYVGKLWRQYGDVFQVRIGRRTLVFAMHPDAVEHVNVSHRQNYDKRGSYDAVRSYLTGEGLVASTGELWRRQRKLMAPFYTPKGVQAYAELMIRDGERLVSRWQTLASQGTEVEIAEEMTTITASIILKAMFSTETMESIHQMKDAVEAMITFVSAQLAGVGLPAWLPTAKRRRYDAARQLVHRSISTLIAKRRSIDEAQWPDDLLSRLMKARDDETGQAMSESLLRDESITTFFAGHETTARTMTFAWYALATNPQVTQRLHEELDRVLGGRLPTADGLRQLPYTLQVSQRGAAALPGGAVLCARRPCGGSARRLRRAKGRGGDGVAVLHPPPSAVLEPPRGLRSRPLDARAGVLATRLRLPPVRRRSPHLHRQQLLAARDAPAAGDARPSLHPPTARRLSAAVDHARHPGNRQRPTHGHHGALKRMFSSLRGVPVAPERVFQNERGDPAPPERVFQNERGDPAPPERVFQNERGDPAPPERVFQNERGDPAPPERVFQSLLWGVPS